MAPSTQVTPAAHEHHFGVDELFFSTTDRAGIIELANSTFVRLSHYPHDELVGAPHNIIRHPDMPGGAFKLVWDQLFAGKPACAYVKNMAKDGGTYWVFATLLPVGDKLLSVRKRPLVTALKEASNALYESVRPHELAAREEGASRDEAAEIGLGHLVEGLAPLGIASADDLALATLPAEIAEHVRLTAGLPYRPDATGPLGQLLEVMRDIDAQTDVLVRHLDEYAELVGLLEGSFAESGPASARLRDMARAAAEGSAVVEPAPGGDGDQALAGESEQLGILSVLASRMSDNADTADDRLLVLGESLHTMATQVRWLRMRIALLRLHNTMVGTFAAELIDGLDLGDSMDSMALLCRALREGAEDLTASYSRVGETAGQVPTLVEEAVRQADRLLRQASKWRHEVGIQDLADEVRPQLDLLEDESARGFGELTRFYDIAARCTLMDDPYDPQRLAASLKEMNRAVDEYADTRRAA